MIKPDDLRDFVSDLRDADHVMKTRFDEEMYDMRDLVEIVRVLRGEAARDAQKTAMEEMTKTIRDSRRGEEWRGSEDPPIGG